MEPSDQVSEGSRAEQEVLLGSSVMLTGDEGSMCAASTLPPRGPVSVEEMGLEE